MIKNFSNQLNLPSSCSLSAIFWKYIKIEYQSSYGRCFTEETVIAKPLNSKFSDDKNKEVLTCRNTLKKQVNNNVDNNLNPSKVNEIDPTKYSFTQPTECQTNSR